MSWSNVVSLRLGAEHTFQCRLLALLMSYILREIVFLKLARNHKPKCRKIQLDTDDACRFNKNIYFSLLHVFFLCVNI